MRTLRKLTTIALFVALFSLIGCATERERAHKQWSKERERTGVIPTLVTVNPPMTAEYAHSLELIIDAFGYQSHAQRDTAMFRIDISIVEESTALYPVGTRREDVTSGMVRGTSVRELNQRISMGRSWKGKHYFPWKVGRDTGRIYRGGPMEYDSELVLKQICFMLMLKHPKSWALDGVLDVIAGDNVFASDACLDGIFAEQSFYPRRKFGVHKSIRHKIALALMDMNVSRERALAEAIGNFDYANPDLDDRVAQYLDDDRASIRAAAEKVQKQIDNCKANHYHTFQC